VENKLRESDTRYQRLVELSPDPLFIESGGKLVFLNRPAVKLFGADHPDQLVGKPAISVVHPDSRNSVNERLAKLRANSEVIYFDQRLLRLDGKAVDVKVAAALLTYQDKPAVQFIARDVSERRRVEDVIKSLAAFAQLNPNPVFEFSRDGKLTYFNEAAAEMAKSLGHDQPSAVLPPDTVSLVQMCLTSGQKKTWTRDLPRQPDALVEFLSDQTNPRGPLLRHRHHRTPEPRSPAPSLAKTRIPRAIGRGRGA